MPNQELIDYIKQSKQKGFSDEEIRKTLLDAGWEEEDIEKGLKGISEPTVPESSKEALPVSAAPTEITSQTKTIQRKPNIGRIIKWGFWGFITGALVGGLISVFTLKSFYLWVGIIIVFIALFALIGARKYTESKIISQAGLTKGEKIAAIVFCIINPVITGAIMYFMWRKKYPKKARQANHISLIIFLIEIVGSLAIFGID